MKKMKMGMGRKEMKFMEEGGEWRSPNFLYADDLVLCGKLEEEMIAMVG